MACTSCGEVDLTPCAPTIPVEPISYKKCNPCKKVTCKQKLDSSCVVFKWNQANCGKALDYLDIENNTNLETVVEKIDTEFNKITKPTLLNCFVTKSGISPTTYKLNDVLVKLQEAYCQQFDFSTASIQRILEIIRDTPALSNIFCQIVSNTCGLGESVDFDNSVEF